MKRSIYLLIAASLVVYGLQLMIFRDPNTTAFYILQDIAFLPISIAVATIVVGEYLNAKEKRERQEKTQMLTSSFFTELGLDLLFILLPLQDDHGHLQELFKKTELTDHKSLDAVRKELKELPFRVKLDSHSYDQLTTLISSRRDTLMVISSNPLLLDHADFTKLLWGLFHLLDEFRLRGSFEKLSDSDITHMEDDFSNILKLLLINWARNVLYTKNNFPDFYKTATGKLFEYVQKKAEQNECLGLEKKSADL